jgi:hypothetical protein
MVWPAGAASIGLPGDGGGGSGGGGGGGGVALGSARRWGAGIGRSGSLRGSRVLGPAGVEEIGAREVVRAGGATCAACAACAACARGCVAVIGRAGANG